MRTPDPPGGGGVRGADSGPCFSYLFNQHAHAEGNWDFLAYGLGDSVGNLDWEVALFSQFSVLIGLLLNSSGQEWSVKMGISCFFLFSPAVFSILTH